MRKVNGVFLFLIMSAGVLITMLSTAIVSAETAPIIYMQDTTASFGLSTHSGRPIHAEYVTGSSTLVGKQIDTMVIKLKKETHATTGIVQVGVFNTDLSVKRLFGTKDASALTLSYKDYTFSLPSSDEPYQIQAGDRIGIKFAGGSSRNHVSIMTDQNSANPFDGTNSYHTYYKTAWNNYKNDDLYMTLKLVNSTPTVSTTTPADITPPVITLLGSNPVTTPLGSTYVDAGATALDNIDGYITSSITTSNPVNISVLGTYTITYNVKDKAGNAATQIIRTVNVIDTGIVPGVGTGFDKNGISYVQLLPGYTLEYSDEAFTFNKNFRSDGSMRADFVGVRDSVIVAGYFKVTGSSNSEEISAKLNGGPHNDVNPERADTMDLGVVNLAGTDSRVRWEKTHPQYSSGISPTSSELPVGDIRNKWVGALGMKINLPNGNIAIIGAIDPSGLDANGKPSNNWKVTYFHIFKPSEVGLKSIYTPYVNTIGKPELAQNTIRVDGQKLSDWTSGAAYKFVTAKTISVR